MFISDDTGIFEPKKRSVLTQELRSHMNSLNKEMYDVKTSWAYGYMHYNLVSREGFFHRFDEGNLDESKSEDGVEEAMFNTTTAEEQTGKYIVAPLVKNITAQYISEFESRDYDCMVRSIALEPYKNLVQHMMNQVFDTVSFRKAINDAFQDAVIKGTGFIRTRMYDQNRETEIQGFTFNKRGRSKSLKKRKTNNDGNKGLKIEYVDVENVIFDPECDEPREFFITTPVSDLELIEKFPQLKSYLNLKTFGDEKKENKGKIKPESLEMYKMGEYITKWYKKPDTIYALMNEISTDDNMKDVYHDVMGYIENIGGSELGNYGFAEGCNFEDNWYNFFGGGVFNSITGANNKKYRINEYYNLAEDKYILFVGDYVLYDGPMLEPHKDNPLSPIYFRRRPGNKLHGYSVNDCIHDLQVEASENQTTYKQALRMATMTLLQVNYDRIPEEMRGKPMNTKLMTEIPAVDINPTTNPQPVIQQIPIQNQAVGLLSQQVQNDRLDGELTFPGTRNLTAQIGKDGVANTIYSPDLTVHHFLKVNAEELSSFAYKVFGCKMLEIEYLSLEGGYNFPFSEGIVLFVRTTSEELEETKQQVAEALAAQYEQRVQEMMQQMSQDPAMQQQIQALQQQVQAQAQQTFEQVVAERGQPTPEAMAQFQASVAESMKANAEALLREQATGVVPVPEDNNLYFALDQVDNLLALEKDIEFDFSETKEEAQKRLMNFVNITSNLPLAGLTFDYNKLMRDIAVVNDFNPDVIAREVAPAEQLATTHQTRVTSYLDWQKNPALVPELARKYYGIDMSRDDLMGGIAAYMNLEAERDIKVQSNRIAQMGQNNLVKEEAKAAFSAQGSALSLNDNQGVDIDQDGYAERKIQDNQAQDTETIDNTPQNS